MTNLKQYSFSPLEQLIDQSSNIQVHQPYSLRDKKFAYTTHQ